MNLHSIFKQIRSNLSQVNFEALYPGFHRFPFALYNDLKIILDPADRQFSTFRNIDDHLEKNWNDNFLGNTNITCEGHLIAIWNLNTSAEKVDISALTASIVHEMFHCYQTEYKEKRWADEGVGLQYPLDASNITAKYNEYQALLAAALFLSNNDLQTFLAWRNARYLRLDKFRFYEMALENIEGCALYVESKTYQQLKKISNSDTIKLYTANFPTGFSSFTLNRIPSYYFGMLQAHIFDQINPDWKLDLLYSSKYLFELFRSSLTVTAQEIELSPDPEVINIVDNKKKSIKAIFDKFLIPQSYQELPEHDLQLIGFDPMNAVFDSNMLYHPYFVKLKKDNEVLFLKGPVITVFSSSIWQVETVLIPTDIS